jgi:hypothetical protein
MYLPVLARAGDPISFKRNRRKKLALRVLESSFFRNVSSIRRDTLSLRDRAKIGIPADFDADVALKFGAR